MACLADFFGPDFVFIAYGNEKFSHDDFDLTTNGIHHHFYSIILSFYFIAVSGSFNRSEISSSVCYTESHEPQAWKAHRHEIWYVLNYYYYYYYCKFNYFSNNYRISGSSGSKPQPSELSRQSQPQRHGAAASWAFAAPRLWRSRRYHHFRPGNIRLHNTWNLGNFSSDLATSRRLFHRWLFLTLFWGFFKEFLKDYRLFFYVFLSVLFAIDSLASQ